MTNDRNYYSDFRVRSRERANSSPIRGIDGRRMMARVVFNRDGEEEEYELPCVYEVCPTCEGRGTHVNPSVDAGGLTTEDFAEDPDFAEAYWAGRYDVRCYQCRGERVVATIDRERADPLILKRLDNYEMGIRQYQQEVEAERRFGC